MRWFRIYSEMLDDEKVQMLSPELFKTWINLLCVAATKDGVLPPVETLSFKLRVSPHEMQSRLEELVLAGLIDIRSDKSFEPHNWRQRQWKSDDSSERVRKHREAKRACNDDVTVTVTPPENRLQITDTDYNQLADTCSAAARGPDEISGLNGSTGMIVEHFAHWMNPYAPDYPAAFKSIADACRIYTPTVVRDAFAELKADHADGKVRALTHKAFYGYCRTLRDGRGKRSTPIENPKVIAARKALEDLDARIAGMSA